MAEPTRSTVQILIGGSDYSEHAIYAQTQFSTSASAQTGTATITIRDPGSNFAFTEGSIMECIVGGTRMWRGFLFDIDYTYVFEDDAMTRAWVLSGPDLNIILDKLILYNHSDPAKYPDGGGTYRRRKVTLDGRTFGYQVTVPRATYDGEYIRAMLNDFDIDLITPQLRRARIEQVGMINPDGAFTPPNAGITLRNFLIDVGRNVERSQPGSVIWYVDPDAYLVYKDQDDAQAPFWVGTADPAEYYGGRQGENVRGLRYRRSISSIKNDVLVFAGDLDPQPASRQKLLKYRHKIKQASVDKYGRFQYSEVVQQSWMQQAVNARANKIVNQQGDPAATAEFTTFRHGLYPGQIIWVVMPEHQIDGSPLVQNLPIRNITMTFPLPDIVTYNVSCSYDTQDPWGLLLALKRPANRGIKQPDVKVIDLRRNPDQTTKNPLRYSLVKEYPASIGNRRYQCSYGYIRDSMTVYVGKLRQVSVQDPTAGTVGYLQSNPKDGIFQLAANPSGSQRVYVEYHVAD